MVEYKLNFYCPQNPTHTNNIFIFEANGSINLQACMVQQREKHLCHICGSIQNYAILNYQTMNRSDSH